VVKAGGGAISKVALSMCVLVGEKIGQHAHHAFGGLRNGCWMHLFAWGDCVIDLDSQHLRRLLGVHGDSHSVLPYNMLDILNQRLFERTY